MPDFLRNHETAAWIIGTLSVLTFVIGLVIVPIIIIRIPPDYFHRSKRSENRHPFRHPAVRILLLILKNTLGGILLLAGLLMFFLPGQGILTMLIGLTLLDFPGKFKLEKKLVSTPAILRSINWIRARAHTEPILKPET